MSTRIRITDVRHIPIAGGPGDYCGWPVMGGIHDFGAGEFALIFVQGTSAYRTPCDLDHYTIESRSVVPLRRSLDAGSRGPTDTPGHSRNPSLHERQGHSARERGPLI